MRTGYQNPTARTIAATMSKSATNTTRKSRSALDSATASDTDETYITHSVSASQNSIAPGESVTFFVDVENRLYDARAPGISFQLGGQQVAYLRPTVSSDTRTEYSASVSYSDILQKINTSGDYQLTVEVDWPYPAPEQTVSGGSFTVESFDESEMYSFHGFAPTKRNIQPGDSVQFIANVENHSPVETRAAFFVDADTHTLGTKDVIIQPRERRNVVISHSYDELKKEVGGTGDYQLSANFDWSFRDVEQSRTWGTLSILGENETIDDGGDGDNNDGTETPDDGNQGGVGWFRNLFDSLVESVPSLYLLAGGGGFFVLLLFAVLI